MREVQEMAHEIYKDDRMFSGRDVPWHGLGQLLKDYPTIEEAKEASGLIWEVEPRPVKFEGLNGVNELLGYSVLMRKDTGLGLGVVGSRYEVYQNEEMWKYIESFAQECNMNLETAGSLKHGRKTWVLAKAKNGIEPVKGDKVDYFFLFSNSFDGSTPIRVAFTPVRVVCNNTLSLALNGTENFYSVRHTSSASGYLEEVLTALKLSVKYELTLKEMFNHFVEAKISDQDVEEFVKNKLFPSPKKEEEKTSTRAETIREKNIDNVISLYQSGAGTDIKGVKGTAYGLMNAVAEYADHEMRTRGTDDLNRKENKFSSIMGGSAQRLKQTATLEIERQFMPKPKEKMFLSSVSLKAA